MGEAYLDPELLLAGAMVDQVPADGNRLGMGLGRSAVQVVVPADRVGQVIAAVSSARLRNEYSASADQWSFTR